jgi:hypothetical protein
MKVLKIGATKGEAFTLLKNIEDVRRYVDNYSMLRKVSIGIGDLSQLSQEAQAVLLKFIEEGVEDIMCYASRDNVSPVLMSRFNKVEKYDEIKMGEDSFDTFVQEQLEKVDRDSSIERAFVGRSAPHLDSFLIYRRLGKAVIARVGMYL